MQIWMERLVGVETDYVSYHRCPHGVRFVGHVVSLGHLPPELDSRLPMVLPAVTECGHMSVHRVQSTSR